MGTRERVKIRIVFGVVMGLTGPKDKVDPVLAGLIGGGRKIKPGHGGLLGT